MSAVPGPALGTDTRAARLCRSATRHSIRSRSPRRRREARRVVAASLAVATLALGTALAQSGPAAAQPGLTSERAQSATAFLDSLGINVHMGYGKTPYADANNTIAAIRQLGLVHVRENYHPGNKAAQQRLLAMRDAGIRFDFIVPRPDEGGGTDPTNVVATIARDFPGATDAVEGPNEYDDQKTGWVQPLRSSQQKLSTAVRTTPALANVPIYGPSLINFRAPKDAPKLGDMSSQLDFGNIHSYPGGRTPEMDVGQQLELYRDNVSGGKPAVATETGYHNAIHNTHRTPHPSTTERTAAIYYPRLYLDYFRRGIVRTYGYELFDQGTSEDQEDHFGLFRVDGSPKPAADAVSNLTKILSDDKPAPDSALAFGLSDSDGDASDLSHVLLQKSDGSFYLALWRTSSVATPGQGSAAPQDQPETSSDVTVRLGQAMTAVSAFHPTGGAAPTQTWPQTDAVTTAVGPDVTLLQLTPQGVPAPGLPPTPPGGGNGTTPNPPTTSGGGAGTAPGPQPSQAGQGNPGADQQKTEDTAPPQAAGIPTLRMPHWGTTDPTPVSVIGKRRLLPPEIVNDTNGSTGATGATGTMPSLLHYAVDGRPLASDVLNGDKLHPGQHLVTLTGVDSSGQPVQSARIVDVGRRSPVSMPLLLLALALVLTVASGVAAAQRRTKPAPRRARPARR